MNATVSIAMMGILVVGPFFLTEGLGLTPAHMGAAMSVGQVSSAVSAIPAGRLTDTSGHLRAAISVRILITTGAALVSTLRYLFGVSGFIMARAPETAHGMPSGVLNLSRNLGFGIGAGVMSTILWALLDATDPARHNTTDFTTALNGTFLAASLLGVSVCALTLVKRITKLDV